jgi:hypothetical protein
LQELFVYFGYETFFKYAFLQIFPIRGLSFHSIIVSSEEQKSLILLKYSLAKLGVVVQKYNPCTQEAETGGSQVLGQPELYINTLSKKKKKFSLTIFPFMDCAFRVSSKNLSPNSRSPRKNWEQVVLYAL